MFDFDWDDENIEHIARHGVEPVEAEEALDDRSRLAYPSHDGRTVVVGRSEDGRLLAVIVERRGRLRRVITARNAGERERRAYQRRKR